MVSICSILCLLRKNHFFKGSFIWAFTSNLMLWTGRYFLSYWIIIWIIFILKVLLFVLIIIVEIWKVSLKQLLKLRDLWMPFCLISIGAIFDLRKCRRYTELPRRRIRGCNWRSFFRWIFWWTIFTTTCWSWRQRRSKTLSRLCSRLL